MNSLTPIVGGAGSATTNTVTAPAVGIPTKDKPCYATNKMQLNPGDAFIPDSATGNMVVIRDGKQIGVISCKGFTHERELANAKDPEALYQLAKDYKDGNFVAPDSKKATALFIEAAQTGHITAQHEAGVALVEGNGIKSDIHRGLEFLHNAASNGNTDSQHYLGKYYAQNGNSSLAEKFLKTASQGKHPEAQFDLANLYSTIPGKYKEAVSSYELAAKSGHSQANLTLGDIYTNGKLGVTADFAKAKTYYTEAQRLGNPYAQTRLDALQQIVQNFLPSINNSPTGIFTLLPSTP